MYGQRPSDDPNFARLLVQAGIDSVAVTPDSFLAVKTNVSEAERETGPAGTDEASLGRRGKGS
ncbi:hypothetical protein [Microtetraspora glauca]|uniref:GP-PDE domain-containing protein n=1 Tax=Microtetraspora glauca TaxID=1996 RepID=A0ABV3GGY6_MICGL